MAENQKQINNLAPIFTLVEQLRLRAGMNAKRTFAALIGFGLLLTTPLAADSVTAPMQVSVQVLARAIVTVDSQPNVIEITADDISRGYVDVNAPIMVRVRTNSRRGYMLQVEKTSEIFSALDLSLPSGSMNVASHESWIQRPYVSGGDVIPVHARLFLSPGATPGSHALPVAFSASPL
jgi:hypothetical protein